VQRVRLSLVVLLLAAAAGSTVAYADGMEHHYPYVDGDRMADDGAAHAGERAYLWTHVVSLTDEGVLVRTEGVEILVTGVETSVSPGDVLQVYGTVESENRVAADRTVRSDPVGIRYMFGISGVAALLVGATLLRHWRPDVRTLTLRRR